MTSTTQARPMRWYYGWNIVAAAVLALTAADGVPLNCLSQFLPPWSAEFHVPISQILFATFPMMIVMAVSSAVIGSLADKKPARWLLAIGLGGLAVASLIGSFATAAWQIEALYAVLIPLPMIMATSPVCNPVVSRWFVRRLGLALGLTSFGISLGGVILPPLVAGVLPLIGWRALWRISAAITGLIVLPIVFAVVRDRPTEREGLGYVVVDGAEAGQARAHGHGGHGGGGLRILDILKRKNFWLVLAVFLTVGCISIGGQYNVAPLALSWGFSPATGARMIQVFNLSNLASMLICGLLADRFGVRVPLAALAFATGASGLLLGFGGGIAPLAGGVALMGFGNGIWTVLPAAAAVEFGAANTGRVFGLYGLVMPGFAIASSGIARVKEVTGSYSPIFIPLGVLCLIGGVAVFFMRERRIVGVLPAAANGS